MIALPDTQNWIDRLRDMVPDLAEVGGSLELATRMAEGDVVSPSVYVAPMSVSADPNGLDMAISQQATLDVAIITIVYNHAGADLGGDAHLRHIRQQVMTALLGWTPCDSDPVEFSFGQRISAVDANLLIWQDMFSTDYLMRST
jgi:hypothetical protein